MVTVIVHANTRYQYCTIVISFTRFYITDCYVKTTETFDFVFEALEPLVPALLRHEYL